MLLNYYSAPPKMLVHEYVFVIYRIGLSGEPAPRHMIPSTVSMKPYGEVCVCVCVCVRVCV